MLLIMLLVVDRTIVGRIQLLADKVDHEKKSERLPVRLENPGDDELAMLARSMEELALLVQAAEREYRHVVEDQTESICRFNAAEEITFWNRPFTDLCLIPPAGKHTFLPSVLDSDLYSALHQAWTNLHPEKTATFFTHAVSAKDGADVWYRSTVRANFAADGQSTGGQWIAADVTPEVSAQRKLQDSQKQLAQLSARLMTMQDQERRRLARELHDSTAQNLSALEMNTSLLESMVTDDRARQLAAETRAISRQVCEELRNISYLLHPPLLEEAGLVFAIRWFTEGFTKRNGIPVFLDLPGDFPRLDGDAETALFRIVQEALSNIYRHAGATKAWITLRRQSDQSVSMEVRDNGEGLPEGFSLTQSSGVGLAGMRERMKQLGGSLEVASSPYGVSVQCRLAAILSDENASSAAGLNKEGFASGS
jgi:signal transduction histidine kinase